MIIALSLLLLWVGSCEDWSWLPNAPTTPTVDRGYGAATHWCRRHTHRALLVTSGQRSCPQEAPRARQLLQVAECCVGMVMMIIRRRHRAAVSRRLADWPNDCPHRLGLGCRRQPDLSGGPLIAPSDRGQDRVSPLFGCRTQFCGLVLAPLDAPALAIAQPPSSARMARTISRSWRASTSARILVQSTPAFSCRRADSHALEI